MSTTIRTVSLYKNVMLRHYNTPQLYILAVEVCIHNLNYFAQEYINDHLHSNYKGKENYILFNVI